MFNKDEVLLECEVAGGYPDPVIVWKINSVRQNHLTGRNNISFNASFSMDTNTYQCEGENAATNVASELITLVVRGK